MEINDDLEIVFRGPSDSFLKVGKLTLNERFTAADIVRPVTDRDANMVEAGIKGVRRSFELNWNEVPSSLYGSEIGLGDEGIPMLLQCSRRDCLGLILTKRPFIDDFWISCGGVRRGRIRQNAAYLCYRTSLG